MVGRNRAAVLALSLVLAAGLGVLRETSARVDLDLIFLAGTVVVIGAFALAVAALHGNHPARFRIRPGVPAFDTPPHAGLVLLLAALTLQGGATTSGIAVDLIREGGRLRSVDSVPAVLWFAALALGWWVVFRDEPVRLTPGGIEDRQAFGSIVVPWEAFAGVPYPSRVTGRDKVSLMFSDAGLVRRRGWRPIGSALPATGVDARFLSYAVHEYAHHPESRAAIGTEAELARLTAQWETAER